jgi:hypothetical protein
MSTLNAWKKGMTMKLSERMDEVKPQDEVAMSYSAWTRLINEVAQLEAELEQEKASHNFALALMQKAIDAADIYREELLGFYTEPYIDALLTERNEDA